jgi:hypothetical protein
MLFHLVLDGFVEGLYALPRDIYAFNEDLLDAFDFFL